LRKHIKRCNVRRAIGLVVRIPEIAKRRIRMPGGVPHDGFFCVTDTGSPYYIRADRIDIFVGAHGGGNPYLPPARRGNFLLNGGIASLVPSDWRLWKSENKRVWCPRSRLPGDPRNPAPGDCTHAYHAVAAHKALTLIALFHKDGRPVRCRR